MTWLIVISYVLVTLFAARYISWAFREDLGADGSRVDAVMTGFMSLLVATLWPLILPVFFVLWRPKPTTAELATAVDEHQAEKRELQRRIAELESEVRTPLQLPSASKPPEDA